MRNYLQRCFKLLSVYRLPYEVKPPYTHVVQVGDPVLRSRAEEIQRDDISRDTTKKVLLEWDTFYDNTIICKSNPENYILVVDQNLKNYYC